MKIVGRNLRNLRVENNLSVNEVKDYLCLGTVQAVYKYETGKGYLPSDNLLALANLYGVSVEYLVRGSLIPTEEQSEDGKISTVYEKSF